MANTTLTADIIAKEALAILENELGWIKRLHRAHESEFDQKVNGYKVGDTISIRRPEDGQVRTGATLSTTDVIEGKTTLTIDQQIGSDFQFTSTDLTLKIEDLSERVIKPRMSNIINYMANDVLTQMYRGIYNWVGTPGELVNSFPDFAKAPERLDIMAVPANDRVSVLSPSDNWALIGAQSGMYIQGAANDAYRDGSLGRLGGWLARKVGKLGHDVIDLLDHLDRVRAARHALVKRHLARVVDDLEHRRRVDEVGRRVGVGHTGLIGRRPALAHLANCAFGHVDHIAGLHLATHVVGKRLVALAPRFERLLKRPSAGAGGHADDIGRCRASASQRTPDVVDGINGAARRTRNLAGLADGAGRAGGQRAATHEHHSCISHHADRVLGQSLLEPIRTAVTLGEVLADCVGSSFINRFGCLVLRAAKRAVQFRC